MGAESLRERGFRRSLDETKVTESGEGKLGSQGSLARPNSAPAPNGKSRVLAATGQPQRRTGFDLVLRGAGFL